MIPIKHHTLAWFINRIGHRIFLVNTVHCCPRCMQVYAGGFIVQDKAHAKYLCESQDNFYREYVNGKV